MLKKDARYHYGILKHVKGTAYRDDYLVTDSDFKTLKYIYRASAQFMADELTKAHSDRCSFYGGQVRLISEEERSEICYECTGYGDDYRWDDELQDFISNCEDCWVNDYGNLS